MAIHLSHFAGDSRTYHQWDSLLHMWEFWTQKTEGTNQINVCISFHPSRWFLTKEEQTLMDSWQLGIYAGIFQDPCFFSLIDSVSATDVLTSVGIQKGNMDFLPCSLWCPPHRTFRGQRPSSLSCSWHSQKAHISSELLICLLFSVWRGLWWSTFR